VHTHTYENIKPNDLQEEKKAEHKIKYNTVKDRLEKET